MSRVLAVFLIVATLTWTPTARGDDSGYPWREAGYLPVAAGTPQETLLMYQVMFPDPAVWGSGPYPVVLDYSGYEPATTIFDGLDDRLLAEGFAIAGVNMRGSHGSGGTFDYFAPQQATDGYDAIEWLASRSWSNGRVAMAGKSWPGISQLYVAAEQPPSLKAIVPGHVFSDLYRDVAFPGGVMNVVFDSYWGLARLYEGYLSGPIYAFESGDTQALINQFGHLPNILLNPTVRALTQHYDNDFYHERSNFYRLDDIEVPLLLIQSWQDEQVGSRAVHLLNELGADVPWRFVGTNGDHAEYFGEDVWPHVIRFLTYHLKEAIPPGEERVVTVPLILPNGKPHPNKVVERPETYGEALARYVAEDPVTINWENGALGGRSAAWASTYAAWPPPQQAVWRLNMRPDATLTEAAYPNTPLAWLLGLLLPQQLGSVNYVYAPLVGTQERGGFGIEAPFVGIEAVPPADWADRPPAGTFAEFTSAPLAADKVLLGTASVDLHIISTSVDTDFEVTLSEIRPDGQEIFVQQGWLRASHRTLDAAHSTALRPYHKHRLQDAQLLLPGVPTAVRIELFPFGHVFRQGSRVRVAVTAPHTHPDLWGFLPMPVPAVNTILTSKVYPSSIALPLLAGETAEAPYPPAGSLRSQPARVAEATPVVPSLPPLPLPSEVEANVIAEGEFLLDVAADMVLSGVEIPGVPLGASAYAAWFADWSVDVDLDTTDTGPSGIPISVTTYANWQLEVAGTTIPPGQSDAWYVDWFDTWYAQAMP